LAYQNGNKEFMKVQYKPMNFFKKYRVLIFVSFVCEMKMIMKQWLHIKWLWKQLIVNKYLKFGLYLSRNNNNYKKSI